MVDRWNLWYLCSVLFVLHLVFDGGASLNPEGLALLEFRSRVEVDPHGAFQSWDPDDGDPCSWFGVRCAGGKVEMLNLMELSLTGELAPELGKLVYLKSISLSKNNLSGVIPKEIGGLKMLEILDLRENSLSGMIPVEIGNLPSLKRLLLCGNKIHGGLPSQTEMSHKVSDMQKDENALNMVTKFDCPGRKDGKSLKLLKGSLYASGEKLAVLTAPSFVRSVGAVKSVRRRLFEENRNLPAVAVTTAGLGEAVSVVPSAGSGSFPAKPKNPGSAGTKKSPPPGVAAHVPTPSPSRGTNSSGDGSPSSKGFGRRAYFFVIPASAMLVVAAIVIFALRRQKAATIGPWRPGLSGQLKKAFITGASKISRSELEAECEDFSNIISSFSHFTVFKGTLSSGVEIAVVSTTVESIQKWSSHSELHYRKKIDKLSKVNHKNFVNLLGYCEENDPFTRMMVFEYAPNGTLFEHLHVKEFEHLDWNARVRIAMGVAYCLQYMHHEIDPPMAHPVVQSSYILITDDYAAKLADMTFWEDFGANGKVSKGENSSSSETLPVDHESNVYSFGVLLLEIISGKIPHSDDQVSLTDWAREYLRDGGGLKHLVDPSLKSFEDNQLEAMCEVIRHCIRPDPKGRPTMTEVACKLWGATGIMPEVAAPRLSPLWWAELEILSVQAS